MRKLGKIFIGVTGFLILVLPVYLYADEVSELRAKIQAVQEENQLLRQKLNHQEALIQQLVNRLEKLEQQEAEQLVIKQETALLPSIPKMQVKGFADISFKVEKADNRADANPGTFTLGELDFMVTSELSDKISFFSESIIEFEETETEIDVERIYLKYSISDLFNIWLGRYHTPMGYWNTIFHHGKWFQNTITRPLIVEYEHGSGGILPMHSVGINLNGRRDIGLFDLEYDFGISNGRGNVRTRVQNMQDGNDAKAFNARLTLKPHKIPGLRLGFSGYVDKIPPNTTSASRNGEIKELILGGYFAYLKDNLEVLFESYNINHDDEVSQKEYDTRGMYLQTSYKLKEKWTPYYRFDFLDFGQGDPYYSGIDIDNRQHTLGLRWDVATWNALKLEYSYTDTRDASDKHSVMLEDSFHF